MGYGVSASIGGQLAAPDKQVVCVCGDGDFLMQGMEVVTAVNYNIPVKWFIFNNQSLAMIRNSEVSDRVNRNGQKHCYIGFCQTRI
jgi:acetolactate synthase-1/2/3 large subunit